MKLRIQTLNRPISQTGTSFTPSRFSPERGVALVVTLILLAVITTLAIAFLGLTRRETGAVDAMNRTTDAELAADSALERARAEILYPFIRRNTLNPGSERLGPDFLVSVAWQTNRLFNYQAFTNPSPPVFVNTNRGGTAGPLEDRFYLDLNRNRFFEDTGYVPDTDDSFAFTSQTNWRVGDPQWIGVLQNPRRGHDTNNPYIARYAYMVMPAGRSLDVNWIHNDVRRTSNPVPGESWYSRNQGVGGYEVNLAAFLCDLNANAWNNPNPPYNARTNWFSTNPTFPSVGTGFDDAWNILSFRIGGTKANMNNLYQLLSPRTPLEIDLLLTADGIDTYALNLGTGVDTDVPGRAWPGSDSTNHLFVPHDFLTRITGLGGRLALASRQGNSYDRYTFYRMLAQLGTDSVEEDEGKVNINYVNVPSWLNGERILASDLIPWSTNASNIFVPRLNRNVNMGRPLPEIFFLTVVTNLLAREPDFALFVTNRIDGTVMSIPVCTNNAIFNYRLTYTTNLPVNGPLYSARLHQLLQIAANILDATTSNKVGEAYPHFPSVFRPWFSESNGNVFITNYTILDPAVQSVDDFRNKTSWVDLDSGGSITNATDLVYGIPLIFGARSGLPNFNELGMVSSAEATRKLIVTRRTGGKEWDDIEQIFTMKIQSMLQIEARNSNIRPYPRPLQVIADLRAQAVVQQVTNPAALWRSTNWFATSSNTLPAYSWAGEKVGEDKSAGTNYPHMALTSLMITNLVDYVIRTNAGFPHATNRWEWRLALTNRLVFYLIDRDPSLSPKGRIIDMVTLSRPHQIFDVGGEMEADQIAGSTALNQIWRTDPADKTSLGIRNQLLISRDSSLVSEGIWGNYEAKVGSKTDAALNFNKFMDRENWSQVGTNQAPFTPTRTMVVASYYQVNDPLVHYTFEDLRDDLLNKLVGKTENGKLGIRTNLSSRILGNNPLVAGWNEGDFAVEGRGADPGQGKLDPTIRDPGIVHPSSWNFPTNLFPGIGWLGRVHRGTPWQTIYLKSRPLSPSSDWIEHTGNQRSTHAYSASLMVPTRDRELFDIFTTAPHPNATRGRLSINQTNVAAWSAVLSGVLASAPAPDSVDSDYVMATSPVIAPAAIDDSVRLIVQSLNTNRSRFNPTAANPQGQYQRLGEILAAPELSDDSPFLRANRPLFDPYAPAGNARIFDEDYERIPQQILSLLKVGEPRFVIYAWGQSLKPAQRDPENNGPSIQLADNSQPPGSPKYLPKGLVLNYQITGEQATRAVIRVEFERFPNGQINYARPHAVVESFNILPPE